MKALETLVPAADELPPFEQVPYYFAVKGGWMTNMPTLFGVGQTKLDKHPTLPDIKGSFRRNERMFPQYLLMQAHSFFKAVWEKHSTESSLYILYKRETDTFSLWAPEQYVTGSSVNHRIGILPKGLTACGTIHSHCNFSAFHSGTDQHDMEGMPGLHVTIGHVDRDEAEYAIALSLGDAQFDVQYGSIVSDSADIPDIDALVQHASHWMGFVKTGVAPWTGTVTKYSKVWKPPTKTHFPGSTVTHSRSSQMQQAWDQQAWGYDAYVEETWEEYIDRHVLKEEREEEQAGDDADKSELPFEKYKDELMDLQNDLRMIADQLADMGFAIDWSIYWDPTKAQERMMRDAPTP
jgi:hypothetical protein